MGMSMIAWLLVLRFISRRNKKLAFLGALGPISACIIGGRARGPGPRAPASGPLPHATVAAIPGPWLAGRHGSAQRRAWPGRARPGSPLKLRPAGIDDSTRDFLLRADASPMATQPPKRSLHPPAPAPLNPRAAFPRHRRRRRDQGQQQDHQDRGQDPGRPAARQRQALGAHRCARARARPWPALCRGWGGGRASGEDPGRCILDRVKMFVRSPHRRHPTWLIPPIPAPATAHAPAHPAAAPHPPPPQDISGMMGLAVVVMVVDLLESTSIAR
jgi:hypothetical protein